MGLNVNHKVAVGAAVVAACAFGGGAYAASTSGGTSSRQAFLNDAAHRLGVTPQHLKDALAGALQDRLNAAVKAGKLTQAQANAIEQRFRQSGGLPLPPGNAFHGFKGRPFGHGRGPLGAAARYLGLSVPQLLDQLGSGKSLAQIASSKGKSTTGLENAIVAHERGRLDKARSAGAITATQEQRMLARLQARVKELVNRTGGLHGFGHRLPGRPNWVPPLGGATLPAPAPGGEVPPPPGALS
jgi:hypothetical protein